LQIKPFPYIYLSKLSQPVTKWGIVWETKNQLVMNVNSACFFIPFCISQSKYIYSSTRQNDSLTKIFVSTLENCFHYVEGAKSNKHLVSLSGWKHAWLFRSPNCKPTFNTEGNLGLVIETRGLPKGQLCCAKSKAFHRTSGEKYRLIASLAFTKGTYWYVWLWLQSQSLSPYRFVSQHKK